MNELKLAILESWPTLTPVFITLKFPIYTLQLIQQWEQTIFPYPIEKLALSRKETLGDIKLGNSTNGLQIEEDI